MKTSAVLCALFAATALAAPSQTFQEIQDAAVDTVDAVPAEGDYPEEATVDTEYPEENNTEYPEETAEYPEEDAEYPAEEPATYEPVKQPCYVPGEKDEYQEKYGAPIYFEEDAEAAKYYKENSPVEEIYYPKQVDANEPCPITYKPKDTGYKGKYKVAVCKSTDGYKECEDVCEDEYTCKEYKPKDTYVPSDDSDKGCMYKFKVYEVDTPEKCTYSHDFPIYNPGYYEKNKDCKPAPEKCPPPVYAIPAKPVEPVTPVKPVAPVTPVAPPTNVTEEIVKPVDTSSSSALRVSFSAIVGFAAVAVFAL